MAKRMLKFGNDAIQTIFPWLEPEGALAGDKGKGGKGGKGDGKGDGKEGEVGGKQKPPEQQHRDEETGVDADTEAPLEVRPSPAPRPPLARPSRASRVHLSRVSSCRAQVSPWSHTATVSFECRAEAAAEAEAAAAEAAAAGAMVPAVPRCLVCGGEPVADSPCAAEAELLECSVGGPSPRPYAQR